MIDYNGYIISPYETTLFVERYGDIFGYMAYIQSGFVILWKALYTALYTANFGLRFSSKVPLLLYERGRLKAALIYRISKPNIERLAFRKNYCLSLYIYCFGDS